MGVIGVVRGGVFLLPRRWDPIPHLPLSLTPSPSPHPAQFSSTPYPPYSHHLFFPRLFEDCEPDEVFSSPQNL